LFGACVKEGVVVCVYCSRGKKKNRAREIGMEGRGGGEVRRLHIIYFLSQIGGRADHPHLIRVLHLARNGVYLRGELSLFFHTSFSFF